MRSCTRKLIAVMVCMVMLGNMGLVAAHEAVQDHGVEVTEQQIAFYQFYEDVKEYMQYHMLHGNHDLRTRETLQKLIELNYDEIRYELDFVENTILVSDNDNPYLYFLIEDEEIVQNLFDDAEGLVFEGERLLMEAAAVAGIVGVIITICTQISGCNNNASNTDSGGNDNQGGVHITGDNNVIIVIQNDND